MTGHDDHGPNRLDRDGNGPADPALDELLGAYVLGAVDDHESRLVEAYLDRSPTARAEVERLTFALGELTEMESAEFEMPPGLWDNIAASLVTSAGSGTGRDMGTDVIDRPIDLTIERSAAASAPRPERETRRFDIDPSFRFEPSDDSPPGGSTTGGQDPDASVVDRRLSDLFGANDQAPPGTLDDGIDDELAAVRERKNRRRRVVTAVVAAAAMVVVVLAGAVAITRNAGTGAPTESALVQDAEKAAAQPGSLQATLSGVAGVGNVQIVVDPSSGHAFAVPHDVPAPSSGHAYQLWVMDDATAPVSLGVMGNEPAEMVLPDGAAPSQLGISVEPTGGSPSPTTPPILVGTLA